MPAVWKVIKSIDRKLEKLEELRRKDKSRERKELLNKMAREPKNPWVLFTTYCQLYFGTWKCYCGFETKEKLEAEDHVLFCHRNKTIVVFKDKIIA